MTLQSSCQEEKAASKRMSLHPERLQELESTHERHIQITYDEIERFGAKEFHGFETVRGNNHFDSPNSDRGLKQGAGLVMIIDDQNANRPTHSPDGPMIRPGSPSTLDHHSVRHEHLSPPVLQSIHCVEAM